MNDFTTTFTVEQTPDEVFAAVTNVRGWWIGEIDGNTDGLGDEFVYRYQDLHRSTQRITELVPGRRVVWHVVEGHVDFVADTTEWTGTDITFDITPTGDGTELRFTHSGLVPAFECFENCSSAWSYYVDGGLRSLITAGGG